MINMRRSAHGEVADRLVCKLLDPRIASLAVCWMAGLSTPMSVGGRARDRPLNARVLFMQMGEEMGGEEESLKRRWEGKVITPPLLSMMTSRFGMRVSVHVVGYYCFEIVINYHSNSY